MHIFRFFLTFIAIFIVMPWFFRRHGEKTALGQFFRGYMKTALFLIVIGYLLILVKLFEIPTLILVLIFAALFNKKVRMGVSWEEMYHRSQIWIYDWADGLINPVRTVKIMLRNSVQHHFYRILGFIRSPALAGQGILLGGVFLYAAFLRFYETFIRVAPAMSDSYVVIAWLKYVDRKLLFHDGIYPQGFHIYLDYLHKFSALDPVYIVNYAGPLHTMLITLGIYFAVSRWSDRSLMPAFISAVIYGLLGSYLTSDWMRQAAANSQEFAFIFILPVIYLFSVYLKDGEENEFFTGAAGAVLIGLVHSLAYAYLVMGLGTMILAAWISNPRKYWTRSWRLVLAGAAAGAISLVPFGIGLAMGKQFNVSSAQFLVAKATLPPPTVQAVDIIAMAGLALLLIYVLAAWQDWRNTLYEKFILLWGAASLVLYFYVGVLLNSEMIISRSGDLLTLLIPVIAGMGWHILSRPFAFMKRRWFELLAGLAVLAFVVIAVRPQPVIPYKMQYESSVVQYLKISEDFRRSEWTIISEIEGYALAYGLGFHLMLPDLLDYYDPSAEKLTALVDGKEGSLETQNIFIFEEKKVFRAPRPELTEEYDRREEDYIRLALWVEKYRQYHSNLSVYYEDDDIRIYRIYQPNDKEKEYVNIWGGGK